MRGRRVLSQPKMSLMSRRNLPVRGGPESSGRSSVEMTSRLPRPVPPRLWKLELWWLAVPTLLRQFLPKCLKPEKQVVVKKLSPGRAVGVGAVEQLVLVDIRPID